MPGNLEAKTIIVFSDDQSLVDQVKSLFSQDNILQFTELLDTFDYIKDNHVDTVLFETYQIDPFKGVNENDLDVLLFYASTEESQNKHLTFLPLDPSQSNERLNNATDYYSTLFDKYIYLLPPVKRESLDEGSIVLPEQMANLSDLLNFLDDAMDEVDKIVIKHKPVEEEDDERVFNQSHHFVEDVTRVTGKFDEPEEEVHHIGVDHPENEEAQTVKGFTETPDDEEVRVSGNDTDSEETVTISGSNDEENTVTTVSAEDANIDDTYKVSGSSDSDKDEKFSQVISGKKEDLKEEVTKIKGGTFEDEKDDKMVVKSLKGKEASNDLPPNPQDINMRNGKGMTPVMVLARMGQITKAKTLIGMGADTGLLSHQGKTLLHYACRGSDNLDFIEELVEIHGLKINKKDANGHDPFYESIKGDNETILDYLIFKGARLNTKYDGQSVLHLALKSNSIKSFKQLLNAGANLKATDQNGDDVISFCKRKKLVKALKIIAEHSKSKENNKEKKSSVA